MKRIAYIRVSTVEQNTVRQLDGMEFDEVFIDKASGKDVKRPELQAALAFAESGDTLFVHSMDRLARNAEDLLRIVRELTSRGVTVEFVKNHMRFSGDSDPMGKLQLTILGAVAEFERELIRERQREGVAIAKAAGKYHGRAGRGLKAAQITKMQKMADEGVSKVKIAEVMGVTRQSVYRYLAPNALGDKLRQSMRRFGAA
jgi:DNA invertase Pin-like site-specific DNA recombinase